METQTVLLGNESISATKKKKNTKETAQCKQQLVKTWTNGPDPADGCTVEVNSVNAKWKDKKIRRIFGRNRGNKMEAEICLIKMSGATDDNCCSSGTLPLLHVWSVIVKTQPLEISH